MSSGERPETGAEPEMTLQEITARLAVMETVQTQLMVKLSGIFDEPQSFIRAVMSDAEENLSHAREQAPEEHRATARIAFAYFMDYSMRPIDGMTKGATRQ